MMASIDIKEKAPDDNPLTFGNYVPFTDDTNYQFAMTDYNLTRNRGDYINNNASNNNIYEDYSSSVFLQKISVFETEGMSVKLGILMDKTCYNVFKQYKIKYKLIQGMICCLPHAGDG